MNDYKIVEGIIYRVINRDDTFVDITDEIYLYRFKKDTFRKLKRHPKPFIITNHYCINNLKKWIMMNNYKFEVVDYDRTTDKFLWRCECGNLFYRNLYKVKEEKQILCIKCSNIGRGQKLILKEDKICEDIINKGYSIIDIAYKNKDSKITIKDCEGYMYSLTYDTIMSRDSHYKWHKTNPYSIKNIENFISINNMGCKLLSKHYTSYEQKLDFLCECGNIFSCTIDHFMTGQNRCNSCSKKISILEIKTEKWLLENNIEYEREMSFGLIGDNSKPYKYDFYIPSKNLIIEVHGRQYYEFTKGWHKTIEFFNYKKIVDEIKKEYVLSKGIDFLEISHKEFNKDNNFKNILYKRLIESD